MGTSGTVATDETDPSGFYSLQVAPGSYPFAVEATGNSNGIQYSHSLRATTNLSLNQNLVLDIILPFKKVDIHAQDFTGNPISNVIVSSNNPSNSFLVGGIQFIGRSGANNIITNTNGDVNVWLYPSPTGQPYVFTASPPNGSGFEITTLGDISVQSDTTVTIILPYPVTLTGHVYDPNGNPLPAQRVQLGTSGTISQTETDPSGFYSLQASAGLYPFAVEATGFNYGVHHTYSFRTASNLSLNQSFILDITLPLKKVDVHVQDAAGNPVSNVFIATNNPSNSFLVGGVQFIGRSGSNSKMITNANGNISIWLFPSPTIEPYTITATPPSDSPYLPFTLNNVVVTSDQTEIISLQFKNQPPEVSPISNVTLNEGGTYSASGSFSDLDSSASWTATVDYGDGSGVQSLTLSGTNFTFNHVYKNNGTYTVTVSVTDNQGATGTGTATITVNNSDPNVGTITASTAPQQVNTPITASAPFTDPGVLDTHTAVWNWGDGTTSADTVTESDGSGSVSDSHNYTTAGVYTITLTVTDNNGSSGQSIFQYVVVYDPSAGYVTGAGTITSPQGAYTQDPFLSGKAVFGFVSKYQNGANVPTGNTQFNFVSEQFKFKSTSYEWLVVAGPKGQYKGSGEINNSGDYGFMLTAIDGERPGGGGIDKFRLKIWDKTTNEVIYDNQLGASDTADPTTEIDSGSIIIHP